MCTLYYIFVALRIICILISFAPDWLDIELYFFY